MGWQEVAPEGGDYPFIGVLGSSGDAIVGPRAFWAVLGRLDGQGLPGQVA